MKHEKKNVNSCLKRQSIYFAERQIFQGDFAGFLVLNVEFKKRDMRKINIFSIPLPKTYYQLSTSCTNICINMGV